LRRLIKAKPFVTVTLVEVLCLFLCFDARKDFDRLAVFLVCDSVFFEVLLQGVDSLLEVAFLLLLVLSLALFLFGLLFHRKFFLQLLAQMELLHVGLPVLKAFLMPVVDESHITLQLVKVNFANVFLDSFLLDFVFFVLFLHLHRLVGLELLVTL
jgi:hypothetical protein